MRQPEDMSFYAIRDRDNLPRVLHAVRERAPEDALEVTREQAEAIAGAYRTDKPQAKKLDTGATIVALTEARDQIVAIVNEASADRDAALSGIMNRLSVIERIIETLGEKADEVLERQV
jgi:hypothetical protein